LKDGVTSFLKEYDKRIKSSDYSKTKSLRKHHTINKITEFPEKKLEDSLMGLSPTLEIFTLRNMTILNRRSFLESLENQGLNVGNIKEVTREYGKFLEKILSLAKENDTILSYLESYVTLDVDVDEDEDEDEG